jgi:hypothetical protein
MTSMSVQRRQQHPSMQFDMSTIALRDRAAAPATHRGIPWLSFSSKTAAAAAI